VFLFFVLFLWHFLSALVEYTIDRRLNPACAVADLLYVCIFLPDERSRIMATRLVINKILKGRW